MVPSVWAHELQVGSIVKTSCQKKLLHIHQLAGKKWWILYGKLFKKEWKNMKLVMWPTKPLSKIICSPEMMSEQFSSLKNSKAAESICQLHIDPKQRRQEKWKGRCSQDDGEKRTSQCTLAFLLSHARESTPQKSLYYHHPSSLVVGHYLEPWNDHITYPQS